MLTGHIHTYADTVRETYLAFVTCHFCLSAPPLARFCASPNFDKWLSAEGRSVAQLYSIALWSHIHTHTQRKIERSRGWTEKHVCEITSNKSRSSSNRSWQGECCTHSTGATYLLDTKHMRLLACSRNHTQFI